MVIASEASFGVRDFFRNQDANNSSLIVRQGALSSSNIPLKVTHNEISSFLAVIKD